ncbi:MAG TPA: tetratricopeptide repeat protein, partial [Anaerolineae bacterium]|nr:tetratricopeptide repeat protein [Anaerolineae bacterium]
IDDSLERAQLYHTVGEGLHFAGKSAEALNAYRQAATRFAKAKDAGNVAACYTALGTLHLERNQHDQALSALLKACQLASALNNHPLLADSYHKLAAVYYEQDLLDQSLTYAHKSLEAAQLASADPAIANAYNMLGVLNKYMAHYEQALQFYTEALHIRRTYGDIEGEADIQHNIGLIYEGREQYKEALHHYAQALALRKESEDTRGLLRSYAVLGTTHAKLHSYDLANRYLKRALGFAQNNGEKLMEANLYRELAEVYAQLGDYEHAFGYQRRFAELHHLVFSKTRIDSFAEAQAKHAATQDERRAERYRVRMVALEKEVTAINHELDIALAQEADVAIQLKAAQQREKALNGLKSKIIRIVSHEFRTPLAIVSNAAYMLERFAEQMPAEKSAENHARISASVDYMKGLLDDICWIDTATREAIRVQPVTVSLHQLAAAMLDQFVDSAENSDRIQLAMPQTDLQLVVDDGLVQQILYHTISNALKFSQSIGKGNFTAAPPVKVTFHHKDGQLLILIKDQGIGIPQNDLPRIFDLFYQASNIEERRGLGLGLAITDNLVTALNGNIRINSDGVGQGTTVFIAIPCRVK